MTLFNQSEVGKIISRIEQLTPNTHKQWGKMNVSQMLAHCSEVLETAMGRNFPKRIFIGRLIAPFMKTKFLSESTFPKNTPTDKSYVITDIPEFEREKAKVINLINTFYEGGAGKCTSHPHPFFGKFTPEQWALYEWKHFDHHLRQFGL